MKRRINTACESPVFILYTEIDLDVLVEEILQKLENRFDKGSISAEEFTKLYEQYKEELIFTDFQINELTSSKETEITSSLEEPKDSLFCPHCGIQIPRDSLWCPNCGKKIEPIK